MYFIEIFIGIFASTFVRGKNRMILTRVRICEYNNCGKPKITIMRKKTSIVMRQIYVVESDDGVCSSIKYSDDIKDAKLRFCQVAISVEKSTEVRGVENTYDRSRARDVVYCHWCICFM